MVSIPSAFDKMAAGATGIVSSVNSSFTPIGSSATFTGEWDDTPLMHALVNVVASHDGTLTIEFGVYNPATAQYVTTLSASRPIYAGTPYFRVLVKGAGRAMRVSYTNGIVAQTSFTLYTEFGSNLFPASSSDDNEILITETERERDTFVAYTVADVSASGYAILIDLSDTTNFPHDRTGRIDLSAVYISVDRDSTATGRVRVGVITRVDGTNADITYVQGVNFAKSDERTILRDRRFSPSQIKLGVTGGVATRVLSSGAETNVAAVNTATPLASPRGAGTVTPAVGDVILNYERTAGSYNLAVSATYHGEASA